MRSLTIDGAGSEPLRVVCIGAHADDLEIGCGGTIRQLAERHPGSAIRWWVLTGDEQRRREARDAAERLLGDVSCLEVCVSGFRDGYLPAEMGKVKDAFEAFRRGGPEPDVIYTHTREDRHQDHRLVSDLTWNTWRDHVILEYEIPKWDGDLGQPNVYVPLTEATVRRKIDVLLSVFATQHTKPWFDEATFRGLLRLRGLECRAAEGYAEAFHARKLGIAP
jgi:LmbE family N-acetylglucosaminyl deacetylase